MKSVQRRSLLLGATALSVIPMTTASQDTRTSTMKPFSKGDVFVGATLLNNPADDHAGLGRIIQYDADLNEKGVLWIEGTSHLVGGLSFAPDGTMWGFDNLAWLVFTVGRDGKQRWTKKIMDRALGKVQFLPNGNLLFSEYFVGDAQPETLTTRYKTLPDHPGQVGVGQLYEMTPDLKLVRTFKPDVHGGMSRSMAITHATLGSDGQTLVYTSETGNRVMRFDLANSTQGADLKVLPPSQGGPPAMVFDVARAGRKILLPLGNKLVVVDEQSSQDIASIPLPGFGWAVVSAAIDGAHAYAANWFTGDVVKVSLTDNAVVAQIKIAPKCISGLAQFPG
jgi:hypothetical protein